MRGTFLVAQQLRLCASTAKERGSHPWSHLISRYAVRCGKDETKVKEMYSWTEESFQNYTHGTVSFFFFF